MRSLLAALQTLHLGGHLHHRSLCGQSMTSYSHLQKVLLLKILNNNCERGRLYWVVNQQDFRRWTRNVSWSLFCTHTVMWTTSSEDHINSSPVISHNLYRNDTKSYCVLKTYVMGPNETLVDLVQSQISEPAIASEFKFRSIHSIVFGDWCYVIFI